ncbi:MAG: hypothetical protein AB7V77_02980 [Candidatus Woesearchaeota archaeon]
MQIFNCVKPSWFMGMDVSLEFLFAIITIMIAFFAYKAYKLVKQREVLFFSLAFLSISIAYLQQVIFNVAQIYGLSSSSLAPIVGSVAYHLNLGFFVALIHIILFTIGLSILVYLTIPKRNKKIFVVISGLSLIALITSFNIMFTSFLINSLLLMAITLNYYQLLNKKKTKSALYNYLGFGAIFLGQVQLAVVTQFSFFYVAGHIVTFLGYILLLLNLYDVIKNR